MSVFFTVMILADFLWFNILSPLIILSLTSIPVLEKFGVWGPFAEYRFNWRKSCIGCFFLGDIGGSFSRHRLALTSGLVDMCVLLAVLGADEDCILKATLRSSIASFWTISRCSFGGGITNPCESFGIKHGLIGSITLFKFIRALRALMSCFVSAAP
jgi:hypothetical protein